MPHSTELVTFSDAPETFDRAAKAYERLRHRLLELIPSARIEHVGATAISGLLTKGDLDVQIIVSSDGFDAAKSQLMALFHLHPGGFSSAASVSFKDDDADPELGVHLTVAGSADDFQWRCRDMLLAQPELVAELTALKRRHEGCSMDGYREEKAIFFWRLQSWRTACFA